MGKSLVTAGDKTNAGKRVAFDYNRFRQLLKAPTADLEPSLQLAAKTAANMASVELFDPSGSLRETPSALGPRKATADKPWKPFACRRCHRLIEVGAEEVAGEHRNVILDHELPASWRRHDCNAASYKAPPLDEADPRVAELRLSSLLLKIDGNHPVTPDDLPADLRADYEERAAIVEYDGAMPREHAEAAAFGEVCRSIIDAVRVPLPPLDLATGD